MSMASQVKGVGIKGPNFYPEILPKAWMFVDKIMQDFVSSEKIKQETEKRRSGFSFRIQDKSYVQLLKERRARIRKLRSELFETQTYVQSNSQLTREELESELSELLNKPTEFELSETKETHGIPVSQPDPKALEQSPTRINFDKPVYWVLPPKSEQSVPSPQTQLASEYSRQSSVSSCDALNMPLEFLCPITHRMMRFPVIARDGYTYEREAIERWFSVNSNNLPRSPMTNIQLQDLELIPNHNLRKLIVDMTEQNRQPISVQASPMVQIPSRLEPAPLLSNKATQVSPAVSSSVTSPQVIIPERQTCFSVGIQTSFSPKGILEPTFRTKAIAEVQVSDRLPRWLVSDLEWELGRRDSKNINFAQACDYCAKKEGEWRLPTIWELAALLLQDSLDRDFGAGFYWSSTVAMDTERPEVLFLHFPDGVVSSTTPDADLQVRCVRSLSSGL